MSDLGRLSIGAGRKVGTDATRLSHIAFATDEAVVHNGVAEILVKDAVAAVKTADKFALGVIVLGHD